MLQICLDGSLGFCLCKAESIISYRQKKPMRCECLSLFVKVCSKICFPGGKHGVTCEPWSDAKPFRHLSDRNIQSVDCTVGLLQLNLRMQLIPSLV
eukprot:scaffold4862_cov19-Prasinocladus_malaysianus.AAC.1